MSLYLIQLYNQMFAHRSCVIPFTKKYNVSLFQVQDSEPTIQVLEMIFMNNCKLNDAILEH